MTTLAPYAAPGIGTVPGFMQALESLRGQLGLPAWRAIARSDPVIRSWRYFLVHDPYTRWGLIKPRGYPGDATLMDFAYGHPSVGEHISTAGDIGQQIYKLTVGAPQSKSARSRVELLRRELLGQGQGLGLGRAVPARAISFAAGHARELEGLPKPSEGGLARFTAIDMDADSLATAGLAAGQRDYRPMQRNVIRDDLGDVGQAELVYSLGLFDYLDDRTALTVLQRMLLCTAADGRCIVANLSHEAANLGYCEAIMDWWMTTRQGSDLYSLAQRALDSTGLKAEVRTERRDCFEYLMIDVHGSANSA